MSATLLCIHTNLSVGSLMAVGYRVINCSEHGLVSPRATLRDRRTRF
jgi:hypothetical protein